MLEEKHSIFEERVLSMIRFGWNAADVGYKNGFEKKIIDSILRVMGLSTEEYFRWVNDNSEWRRYDFPLDEKSVIVDVGGYDGKWAEQMFRRYGSNMHIFEPVKSFYNDIVSLFSNIAETTDAGEKINVYNVGLSDVNKEQMIYLAGDATTIYLHNENQEKIKLIDFNEWIKKNKVENIDLLKSNCEGEEYKLLMSIIKAENHTKIKNILVQFHRFPEYYESYREAIHNELKKTHDLKFCYDFIWECWTLKEKK